MHAILGLPGWAAAVLVCLLPFLEASTLLGVIVPGEATVILGGVLAYFGRLPLWAVMVLASAGAVVGDSIGYAVGARWGERLVRSPIGRFVGEDRWARARRHLQRKGALPIVFARFAPGVRSLAPGAAGTARMPYRRFLVANAIGGVVWAVASSLAGYLAGTQWRQLEKGEHWVALGGLALLIGWILARRLRGDRGR